MARPTSHPAALVAAGVAVAVCAVVAIWSISTIRTLLLIVVAGLVLATGLARPMGWLERAGWPRPAAVAAVCVVVLTALVALGVAVIWPLVHEADALVRDLPALRESLLRSLREAQTRLPFLPPLDERLAGATEGLVGGGGAGAQGGGQTGAGGAASGTGESGETSGTGAAGVPLASAAETMLRGVSGLLGGLVSVLLVFVVAVYLAADRDSIRDYFLSFAPADRRQRAATLLNRAAARTGGWVVGQGAICAAVGVATFAVLKLIGVPSPVLLATVAAIAELVPFVGPLAAGFVAVLVALTQSGTQALATLAFFIVFQQVDSYVLAPKVIGKAVRLHPLAVLLAVAAGAQLFGIGGALLAPPAVASVSVLLDEFRHRERAAPPAREGPGAGDAGGPGPPGPPSERSGGPAPTDAPP